MNIFLLSTLFESSDYVLVITYKQQIKAIYNALRETRTSWNSVAQIFGVKKGAIYNLYKRASMDLKPVGRPSLQVMK